MPPPLITYPGGSTVEQTRVLAVTDTDAGTLFAVERTPCHPESPRWPDQPADRCTVQVGERSAPIACHEGHLSSDGTLAIGAGAADGEHGGVRCVVHLLAPDSSMQLAVGDELTLRVDEPFRALISLNHSRCHLATFALNAVLADAWRKDPGTRDPLGSPDFDKLAIVSSKIEERRSLDTYRIGKSLRKKGFTPDALDDADALAERATEIAADWVRARPAISVTPGECPLQERRTWTCVLPQGPISIPCGGTHAREVTPADAFAVEIAWDPPAGQMTMAMRPHAA